MEWSCVCVFLCTSSPWPSLPQGGQAVSPLCAECHLARQAGHVTSSCIGTTGAQWPMPSCFEGHADPTCMCPHKHTETCTHMNITNIFMWHSFYPTDLLLHVFKIKQCLCAAIAEKNTNIPTIIISKKAGHESTDSKSFHCRNCFCICMYEHFNMFFIYLM